MPHGASASTPARTRRVLLLCGHRVDASGRQPPRFTPTQVPAVQTGMARLLAQMQTGPSDLALTQGAAGADLMWAEACLLRGTPLRLLLPLPEPQFIAQSVLPSADGPAWACRYQRVREQLAEPPQVMPTAPDAATDPFRACNDGLLRCALAQVPAHDVHLLCVWDGDPASGPGGTAELVAAVRAAGGQVWALRPDGTPP